jgi:hypothetical protein
MGVISLIFETLKTGFEEMTIALGGSQNLIPYRITLKSACKDNLSYGTRCWCDCGHRGRGDLRYCCIMVLVCPPIQR